MGSLRWLHVTIRLKALLTRSIRSMLAIPVAERREDGCCLFFSMLNAATTNAFVIYNRLQKDRGQQEMNCKDFMIKLAEDLIFPWAQERISFCGMQRSSQNTIRDMYNINIPHLQPAQGANPMKRFVSCPRKKDRKIWLQCVQCKRLVCGEHSTTISTDCI